MVLVLMYGLALTVHAGVNITAAPATVMDSYVQRRSADDVEALPLTAILIAQLAQSDAARHERAVR